MSYREVGDRGNQTTIERKEEGRSRILIQCTHQPNNLPVLFLVLNLSRHRGWSEWRWVQIEGSFCDVPGDIPFEGVMREWRDVRRLDSRIETCRDLPVAVL